MPPDELLEPEPPNWEPVVGPRIVFRFLKQPEPSPDDFMSDGERGKQLVPGEHPDILTGVSAFASEAKARQRWVEIREGALKKRSERNKRRQRPLRLSVGDYIAEVLLAPSEGFEIVDLGASDGHLTIRGDKTRLAARVARVYAADSNPT